MAATITLADLRAEFRVRTETDGTQYPTDAQVDKWIAAAYRALCDKIWAAGGGDYLPWTSWTRATVSGQDEYDLPNDFFRMLGVTVLFQQYAHRALRPIGRGERTRYENSVSWGYALGYGYLSSIGYYLKSQGGQSKDILKFVPAPDGAYSFRVDYVQNPIIPTLDADLIDTLNGWDEYILNWCCFTMSGKEETNGGVWFTKLQEAEARILTAASSRDDTDPVVAVDVQGASGFSALRTWP